LARVVHDPELLVVTAGGQQTAGELRGVAGEEEAGALLGGGAGGGEIALEVLEVHSEQVAECPEGVAGAQNVPHEHLHLDSVLRALEEEVAEDRVARSRTGEL